MQNKYPDLIGELRLTRGTMMAMELVEGGDANKVNSKLAKTLVEQTHNASLILLSCGMHGNIVRFLPALHISEELMHEGLTIL